jgi:hypothetical protein
MPADASHTLPSTPHTSWPPPVNSTPPYKTSPSRLQAGGVGEGVSVAEGVDCGVKDAVSEPEDESEPVELGVCEGVSEGVAAGEAVEESDRVGVAEMETVVLAVPELLGVLLGETPSVTLGVRVFDRETVMEGVRESEFVEEGLIKTQVAAPAAENLPGGQAVHTEAPHSAYVLASHGSGAEAPCGHRLPWGHTVGPCGPLASLGAQ